MNPLPDLPERKWLYASDLAGYYRVSVDTVKRWMREGKLSHLGKPDRNPGGKPRWWSEQVKRVELERAGEV